MKNNSKRRQQELLEKQETQEQAALSTRRKFIGGTIAAILAGAGIWKFMPEPETKFAPEVLPPKLNPESISIRNGEDISAVMNELVRKGYKKIFFADGNHNDDDIIKFYTEKCLPAFKDAIPKDALAYSISEHSQIEGGKLIADIAKAKTPEEKSKLLDAYYKDSIYAEHHIKNGTYNDFVKARIAFFDTAAKAGFTALPVDTEHNDLSPDPVRARLADASLKLMELEEKGDLVSEEHRVALANYRYYGKQRVQQSNTEWVKTIKKHDPEAFYIGFVGASHLEEDNSLQTAFNAPVIKLHKEPFHIGQPRITKGTDAGCDFTVKLTDKIAENEYATLTSRLSMSFASPNEEPEALAAVAIEFIKSYAINNPSEGIQKFCQIDLRDWAQHFDKQGIHANTPRHMISVNTHMLTHTLSQIVGKEAMQDNMHLRLAQDAMRYLDIKMAEQPEKPLFQNRPGINPNFNPGGRRGFGPGF